MPHSRHRNLTAYLETLFSRAGTNRYVELRARRRDGGMNQQFFSSFALDRVASAVKTLGARTDVYVGVAARTRQAGGRDAIDEVSTLWADCDGAAACAAFERFRPAPTLVVRSSVAGVHAYWALREAVDASTVEALNRAIADAIGADAQSTDAARILRPPATLNFKYRPPERVQL